MKSAGPMESSNTVKQSLNIELNSRRFNANSNRISINKATSRAKPVSFIGSTLTGGRWSSTASTRILDTQIHNTEMLIMNKKPVLRVGVGGPVGSGKTALLKSLCAELKQGYSIAVVTNDIYTREDAEFLLRHQALESERIAGVETGGCPHTAIREDASMNLAAVDEMIQKFPDLDAVFIESGGDNLSATFSPELSDLTIYVIDVAAGDKIPRKGGPGITRSDLLIINKIDLAPLVGACLETMDHDAKKMRGKRPFVFTNLKTGDGLAAVIQFITEEGMLSATDSVAMRRSG